jgi:WD40 repeat protein/serine/threonine protein kinase
VDRERYRRVGEVFTAALQRAEAERSAFVDAACAGDDDLRAQVLSLLERARRPSRLLDDATPGAAARERAEQALLGNPGETPLPDRIGQYRVLRVLGEGGSAIVYEAEQERPRRRVALKLLRTGLTTTEVLRRFEREAEILGRLLHPGIAQVHEVGVARLAGPSSPAQPFFAMELVDGLRLTAHAERKRLGPRERLELVAAACDAVEHAHSRGVVHRDLKPANILVDASGRPKVLDFGVARAFDSDLSTTTLRTATGQVVGTLPYMSPEQVSGRTDAIDARCDVHALGVIAFELLTGRLPHAVDGLALADAARVIREDDPARIGSIDRALRGDVETIVAKALEKDRARRYQSAADMASDIRRFLAGDPITARPPSAARHLDRFARRHRTLVVAVAAAFLALLLGALVAVRQAVLARRSEAAALEQAYRASLAAAGAALEGDDALLARHHLEAAPGRLRGWEWRWLAAQLDDSVRRLPGTPSHAHELRVSRDGRQLVAACFEADAADPAIAMAVGWDLGTGRPLPPSGRASDRPLRSRGLDPFMVTRAALFRAGEREVEVRGDDDRILAVLRPCDAGVDSRVVALASDGRRAVLMSPPSDLPGTPATFTPCDLATGEPVGTPVLGRQLATCVTDDFRLLANADGGGTVHVFDVATAARVRSLPSQVDYVECITYSPDGRRLATGSGNSWARLWNVDDGSLLGETQQAGMRAIGAVAFSVDGLVAFGGDSGSVRVFAGDLGLAPVVLSGHGSRVAALTFGPPDRAPGALFSVDVTGTALQWDVTGRGEPDVLRGHASYVNPVAFVASGAWFASSGWDGTLRTWDAATWLPRSVASLGAGVFVTHLSVSPDGERIAVGTIDKGLWLVDVATGRTLVTRPTRHLGGSGAWRPGADELTATVAPTALEPTGQSVELLDDRSLATRRVLTESGTPRAWSPDGRVLALEAADDLVLVEADADRAIRRLPKIGPAVHAVAWSPGQGTLATGDAAGNLRAWDLDSGTVRELPGLEAGPIHAIAWSADGSRLAAAGEAGVIHLWDAATWQEVVQLRGHVGYVFSLDWSPDGRTLVSGSGDTTVRLWSTRTPAEVFAARQAGR